MSRWLGRRGRLGVVRTAGVVFVVGLLAACGGSDDADSGDTTTTTEKERTTTTAGDTTTTLPDAATADLWAKTAQEHRLEGGEIDFECPPGGTIKQIWGTEIYTDDSSVCTAAVHVGLITLEDGGTVTIEIQPGEDFYEATVANDVESRYYPTYAGSFTFPDAPPGSGDFDPSPASWTQNATGLSPGDSRTIRCSPGGPPASVWGTGTYTGDSSICTAAVHAGLITLAEGGEVTIDVTDGEDSYTGSSENGVTSSDYPAYTLSYEFSSPP
ncbi:MAG: LCCL domain-containing protein [Acidimicrobiales bacterium]